MATSSGKDESMAASMERLGPQCTENETRFQEFLETVAAPTEQTVAEVVAMITRSSVKGKGTWNVTVLVDGLTLVNPALDWHHVAGHLDVPGFQVPDEAALEMLMRIWRQAIADTFPLSSLVGGLWKNADGQLSFLRQATKAEPEVFSWAHAEKRQEPVDGLTSDRSPIGTSNSCWLCLDLYTTLAALAASGYEADVRGVIEHPLKVCPEVFVLGAATVEGGWGPLQGDIDVLATSYLQTNPNSTVLLKRIWPLNRDMVLRCMIALQRKDPTSVARLLDVCQELRSLSAVLEATPAPFCLELAALSARREYLNLEKWLCDQFASRGVSFMQSSVSFLDEKLREDPPPSTHGGPARLSISVETLAVFLRVLAANAGEVPTDTLQQLKLVQAVAVQAHPELATVISEAGVMEAFPQDVEEEANAAFQKMYQGELSVDDVISLLVRYKAGMEAREQDVYACMAHNLFDEFRFFYKYPEQELKTTALLFGKLISNKLVSSVSLGIAMRYIHDSLKNEPSHKLFKFGVTASLQFKDILDQFPIFANQLVSHTALKEATPELYQAAQDAVAKIAKASHAGPAAVAQPQTSQEETGNVREQTSRTINGNAFQTAMPNAPATPNLLFSTINAETLEQAASANDYPVPGTKTVDRVHFFVNNITSTNVDVKAKELAGVVTLDYYPWFANYLVVKRAAQEPNFHPVYVLLVEKWGDKVLRRHLVSITIHYCKVMLGSKLLKSNSSERTLLKNLGSWLGKLTLGCNKPVLQKHLDIKETILNAYSQGMMLPILSFVRHLMEPCATSVAFKPPNPWTMAILAILVEIYNLDGIRTSIKFEVELLFKQMDLLVSDVEPSNLIDGLPRDTDNNMDFAAAAKSAPSPNLSARGGESSEQTQSAPALDPAVIASLPNLAVINPQLTMVGERLQLTSLLVMSIERALVEIIAPVVERSVTIACMTCQQLVSKDFAYEGDVDVVRRAANTSVAGLAQSLALVTAREPLRIAVTNNLRSLLAQRLEPSALEQVITLLVSDNLDLCCQIVEKAASERSQRELDERLAPSYSARAKARAAGQVFKDVAFTEGRFPAALPEVLKAKPGALTPQQQKVYQDFASIPRTAAGAAQQQTSGRPVGAEASPMDDAQQAQLRSKFIAWIQRMDSTLARANSLGVTNLNDAVELKVVVSEIATVPANEIQALEVAKNIFFSKLYNSPSVGRLNTLAYVGSLVVLREKMARRLPAEAALWFAQLPDDVRGFKDAGEALIRSSLIPIRDIDAVIAKALNAPRYQPAAELLLGLLQTCVLGSDPCLSTMDIGASLEMLTKLASRVNGGQGVIALINQARQVSSARAAQSSMQASGLARPQDPPHLVPSVMKAFDQWARLLEENTMEKSHSGFIKSLRESGLLGDDETNDKFFRIMTQLAVTHCLRSEVQPGVAGQARVGTVNFVAIDAHVRLMVTLVLYHGGGKDLLSKILGAVASCLFQMTDDRASAFSGRPFFRIIIGLLAELSPLDGPDDAGLEYLQVIAGFLYATRPQRVPSFAFPWLQLVSDRRFMPPLLMAKDQVGWPSYIQLLLSQLQFLEPFLRHAELTDVVRLLYKGTLRLLLVLLHDFPEFLGQYHFRLCDCIPISCVQIRNLILSAFPRKMRLPDPFTIDLKLNTLPEVRYQPRTSPPMENMLPAELANEVDMFIAGAKPILPVKDSLKKKMMATDSTPGAYNIPSVNAIVFYIGLNGLKAQLDNPQKSSSLAAFNTPAVQLYVALLKDLDPEGRCLMVNAMANQLRYPNAHTQYFSFAILNLFESINDEKIQEQITRVLLERLIANRPHPWGLLITFIDLIKNPRYDLLNHSFTKVAPEIERLFESVARSCSAQQ